MAEGTNVAGEGAEAVATVACDLVVVAGAFRTMPMEAAAGDVENRCVGHFDFCRRARAALLAG